MLPLYLSLFLTDGWFSLLLIVVLWGLTLITGKMHHVSRLGNSHFNRHVADSEVCHGQFLFKQIVWSFQMVDIFARLS